MSAERRSAMSSLSFVTSAIIASIFAVSDPALLSEGREGDTGAAEGRHVHGRDGTRIDQRFDVHHLHGVPQKVSLYEVGVRCQSEHVVVDCAGIPVLDEAAQ